MKREIQHWLNRIVGLLLLAPLLVWAQADQFYFLARTAPLGSLSAPGQSQEGVYLRWDVLEGELPADVDRLRLLRDGEILLEKGVDEVMTEDQIAVLYQGAAQQRRLLETVTQLQEAEAGAGRSVSANLFAGLVHDRLTGTTGSDTNWGFMASRSDFNIARARYRGYLDKPGSGSFSYELLAVDSADNTARLGRARVDTTRSQQVQAPDRFGQVSQASCDAPEYAKDHYTVALDWNAPGAAKVTDKLASQLFISGFDLYRTTDNLDITVSDAPARDIAGEAAARGHDSRGQVQLPGLEKVNDVLLTLTPDDDEQGPEWLETHDDLKKAGLAPGDHRAYYLVPRDFTGHYGPTVATMVTVPNLTRPAKPWDIRTFADEIPDGTLDDPGKNLTMSFDRVTLVNYLDVYEDNYQICNLAEASASGVLEYVGENERCQDDTRRSLRLDVTDYKIYRFESFEQASRFTDSDGDGVADSAERSLGMQCDPDQQPTGATSNLVDAATVKLEVETLTNSGRERMRFQDTVPASLSNREKGQVFWYRLASVTADKRMSLLTSPQRALFPDRERPASPEVATELTEQELCDCSLETTGTSGAWDFIDDLKRHGTFDFSCDGVEAGGLTADDLQADGQICRDKTVIAACTDSTASSIGYSEPLSAGGPACSIDLPAEVDICGQGQVRIKPEYCPVRKPTPGIGSVISGPLFVVVDAPVVDSCVSLYRTVDGEDSRVATSCGTDTPGRIDYQADKGLFCGYAVTHDGNNNVSVPTDVPCTLIRPDGQKAPSTPQVVSVDPGDTSADLSWRLPVEPVAATLIEMRHTDAEGNKNLRLFSVPVAGVGAGAVQEHTEAIPALVGEQDEWCVRMRAVSPTSIGSDSLSSDWSAPRCVSRTSEVRTPPEYLPWPNQPGLPQGPDLTALMGAELPQRHESAEGFTHILVKLAPVEGLAQECYIVNQGAYPIETPYRVFAQIDCNRSGKATALAAVRPELNFMAYRQGRAPDGTPGEWIQVSPLINYAHWDNIPYNEKTDTNTRFNDPYIKVYKDETQLDLLQFVFVDRYPYIDGHDYRYQLVYFSDDHRLLHWRQTNWVTADPQAYLLAQEEETLR